MDERRTETRKPFAGQAYITYNGRCRCEDVVDVSPNGLQLKSGARLKPGKEVNIFLPIKRGEKWRMCLLKAEVVRRGGERNDRRLALKLRPGQLDTREMLEQHCAAAA